MKISLYLYVVFNLGLAVVLPSWTLSIKYDRYPLQIPFQISLAHPLLNKKAVKSLIQKHKYSLRIAQYETLQGMICKNETSLVPTEGSQHIIAD